ncbi:GtrA family protein [Chitinibacter tainanensis]|uniref:GtrA family protein n=1 Tax=Chitinibacter tainanensis TaxID=230667 RepID=UPI000414EE00|nr:GtrA family protein [Chitinibacter tainanensis]
MRGFSLAAVARQFGAFASVGAVATLLQYAILWLGVEALGWRAAVASGVGYAVSSLLNYALNYRFTFQAQREQTAHRSALVKFYVIAGIGLLLNTALMAGFTHWGLHYWPAQLLTTALCLVWNFIGNRCWTFRAASSVSSD